LNIDIDYQAFWVAETTPARADLRTLFLVYDLSGAGIAWMRHEDNGEDNGEDEEGKEGGRITASLSALHGCLGFETL